jgi:beta-mannosidase
MQIHERHITGFPTIKHYIGKYFKEPKNFESYILATQILQAYALETAITSLRSAKPYNMGSIYWQINDVWPVTSWATVDFYGCWKAGHYAARHYHSDPLLVAKLIEGTD